MSLQFYIYEYNEYIVLYSCFILYYILFYFIFRRVMELFFVFVNFSNVRGMMKELFIFLVKVDLEFKFYVIFEIFLVVEK